MDSRLFASNDHILPLVKKSEKNEEKKPAKNSVEQWKNNILETLSENISKNYRTDRLSFEYKNFPPEHINLYQELQEEIAKKRPIESTRPTITLHINGKNRCNANNIPDLALLSSTGSSLDVQIISQLIEKRKEEKSIDDLSMTLLSSPSPQEDKAQSFWEKSLHHKQELNIISLAAIKCPLYVILNSSMHSYEKTLSRKIDKKKSYTINLGKKSLNQAVTLLHEQLETIKQKKISEPRSNSAIL